MKFEKIDCGSGIVAVVSSENKVITDVDSALDLLMSAKYEAGAERIVVDKKLIAEDFFVLSSGLAGEILQKYINYGGGKGIYSALFLESLTNFVKVSTEMRNKKEKI